MPPLSTAAAPTNVGVQAVIPNIHRRDDLSEELTIIMNFTRCDACRHPMISSWRAKKIRQETGIKHRYHAARGLCSPCYDRKRVFGSLYRDIDTVVVDRLIRGEPVRAYSCERQLAITELTRRGLCARQIAERLRCTPRTVQRHRARLRQQQPA